MEFSGVYTAIITPFNNDESIDYDALTKLIEFNIESGVAGIVPCGTTGESPTLNYNEHNELIKFVVKTVNGRVPIIAGTGSNCTKEAVEMSKKAETDGVDALLLVNPYYNKPTQEGLYLHFKAIADAVSIPCVVYNIKGRTGVNVETKTLLRLIDDCKNIAAVKEASGDLEQIKEVIDQTNDDFAVLSGDDNIALELVKMGGQGVISVISNVIPKEMSKIISHALVGEMEKANTINSSVKKLFSLEFIETNPIPIKYMLFKQGKCNEIYRLPMCPLNEEHKIEVDKTMKEMNL
jgi:4-hydroxy-tetrahydrodipicolinate synthase